MSNSIAVEEKPTFKKYDAEWLQKFDGFEDYSETQLKETIIQLDSLATIVCSHLLNTS
ncbi:MAG: hypothetical protein ABF274_02365 [Nonlabens sp.]|uniref:hypothetical protein n=1 Tax=Nonlabens sp. TaxID=1888209 RepID=UPI00321BB0F9